MTRCCLLVRITQVAANAVAMDKILKQICATWKRFWYFRGWWWGWLCGNLMAWELSILWYIWKTCKWKQRKCWGKEQRESKGLCGSRRRVWVLFIGEKTKQHFKRKYNDVINLPLVRQIWWWSLKVKFQSRTQSEIFLVIFGSGWSCRSFDFLTLVYRDLAVGFGFWTDLLMDFIYIYCRERKWSENWKMITSKVTLFCFWIAQTCRL